MNKNNLYFIRQRVFLMSRTNIPQCENCHCKELSGRCIVSNTILKRLNNKIPPKHFHPCAGIYMNNRHSKSVLRETFDSKLTGSDNE